MNRRVDDETVDLGSTPDLGGFATLASRDVSRRSVLNAAGASVLLGGLGSLLAACSGTSAGGSNTTSKKGSTTSLTVASASSGTVFDPELPAGSLVQNPLLYDSLFDTSTPADKAAAQALLANFEPAPALATKWVATKPDNSEWTLTLNTTATSAYGNKFSSADVLWSFERNLAMKWYGGIFLNRIGITDIKQVTAPSADTIKLSLSGPVGRTYFLQLLGNFIVPIFDSTEAKKHVTADDKWASKWISKNACGFGPYTIKSITPDGSLVVFQANPNYYGKKPFETLTWRQTTETSTQLQLLLRGEAQIIDALSPVQVETVKANASAKVTTVANTGAVFVGFNNSSANYKEVALHQGMAYAIPFDQIVSSVYKGQATSMKSPLPDFFQGATSEYWNYTHDVAKAKQLLAPFNGKNLTLQYRSGDTTLQTLAILIQSALKTAGLTISLQSMDPTSFQTKLTAAELSMWLDTQSTPLVPDSLYGLQLLFPTKPTQVLIHYSNAALDKAVDALAKSSDPTEQVALIKQAQKILVDELPILPLAQTPGIVPTSSTISNIRGHGANFMWAKDLTVS